jgi:APA family basic amino acid/polyamine antiporter
LLSHQNLQYMNASRTFYALSVDGLGVNHAKRVSELGTPSGAVLFIWIGMAGLIIVGGFGFLLSLTTFLLMLTYLGLLFGIFRLRKRRPEAVRPFHAWGYPYVSIVVTTLWIALIAFVGYSNPRSVWFAIGLIAISAPAYLILKRVRGVAPEPV